MCGGRGTDVPYCFVSVSVSEIWFRICCRGDGVTRTLDLPESSTCARVGENERSVVGGVLEPPGDSRAAVSIGAGREVEACSQVPTPGG